MLDLQAVCAQNGTMAALLSWLQYGGEIGSVPADVSLQTEDIIAVDSAVLPQVLTHSHAALSGTTWETYHWLLINCRQ